MSTDVETLIEEIRALPLEERHKVLDAFSETAPAETAPSPDVEQAGDLTYQRQLLAAGLIGQVRPRRRNRDAFERFTPVSIAGEPLSQTVIEERR